MKKMLAILLFLAYLFVMVTGYSKKPAQEDLKWDKRPMVMIDDSIYMDTNTEIFVDADNVDIIGTIISSVDGSELPAENAQSNFGCEGSEYAYYENNVIVKINGKWILFEQETITEN